MIQQLWQGRLWGLRLGLVISVTALVAIGLVCIRITDGDSHEIFSKQLRWVVVGLVGFFAMNLVHYRRLGQISYALFAISVLLLGLLVAAKYLHWNTALLPSTRAVYRWIRPFYMFGWDFQIQPSELAKLSFVMALSWYLRHKENLNRFTGLIGPFALTLLPMTLILLEPDLGTVLLFLPVLFSVLFLAGAKGKHLLLLILLGLLTAPLMYTTLMHDYQKDRIRVLLNQGSTDPYWLRGQGYQLHQAKICIGSGQMHGQGWQESLYLQQRQLPEGHNDFIFAVIAHQWGFIGATGVLLLFLLLILAAAEIALRQAEPFGKLLAVGLGALIATEVFVNAGMTMGLTPITGMNLPFVSYGGTSMLCSFLALGMLINVARHRGYQLTGLPFEFAP